MENRTKLSRRITVEFYLVIHSIVVITYHVALPQLVLKKVCHQTFNSTVCQHSSDNKFSLQQDIIHKKSSTFLLILELIGAVPSIPIQLLLGALSDSLGQAGRKRMLLISPTLHAVQSIVLFLNTQYFSLSIYFLLAAPLVTVFVGQAGGALLLVYIYVADMTPRGSQRTLKLSILVGCFTIAVAVAGVISGWLIDKLGFRFTYLVTFALSVLNCFYTTFFVPALATPSSADDNISQIQDSQKMREMSSFVIVGNFESILTETLTGVDNAELNNKVSQKTIEELTKTMHQESDLNSPSHDQDRKSHDENKETLSAVGKVPTMQLENISIETNKAKNKSGECISDNVEEKQPLNNNVLDSESMKSHSLYKQIKATVSLLFEPEHRVNRFLILLAFGLTCIAYAGEFTIRILYVKHYPFNMSPEEVGYYVGTMKLTRGFGVVFVNKISTKWFNFSDFTLTAIGLVNEIVMDITTAVASSKLFLYLSIASGIAVSLPESCLRAAISKTVTKDRHGSILSAMAAVQTLFIIIARVLSHNIYRMTVSWFPGFQFLVSAGFCLIALFIVIALYRAEKTKTQTRKTSVVIN